MRTILLAALLCMGGVACTVTPAVTHTRVQAVDACWAIRTPFGAGSAVAIQCDPEGEGYRVTMLTAAHCLRLSKLDIFTLMAKQGDRFMALGKIVAEHPKYDIAVISFYSPEAVPTVPLASQSPKVLDELTVVGFAGGRGNRWVAEGVACDDTRATCPVAPGDSGGAVLNAAGELVGIISGVNRLRSGEHVNHHLHHEPILRVMQWVASLL